MSGRLPVGWQHPQSAGSLVALAAQQGSQLAGNEGGRFPCPREARLKRSVPKEKAPPRKRVAVEDAETPDRVLVIHFDELWEILAAAPDTAERAQKAGV